MMPEGWRGRFHIYSPGMKSGGCYLVRLFYLGAWRCVWVSDLVPVDATDSPLLPFSPLLSNAPTKPGSKHPPGMALLKLAAPDMNSDEETDSVEDELMPELDIMHALTGYPEDFWRLLSAELPCFSWDDDEDTMVSTIKSKGAKKPAAKEVAVAIKVTAMKSGKDNKLATTGSTTGQQNKEELKEWIPYIELQELIKELNILFFPSMYEFTSAASCPSVRITKSLPNRAIDMVAPKTGPLYLQIDSPEENCLRMSLAILHPRVLMNSGIPITDESEPAYLLLERFDWFGDCDEVPVPKAFVQTQGYDTIETMDSLSNELARYANKSYQPDLHWDPEVVGYNQALLHWMFRQALQSLLSKRLHILELRCVCTVLRHYFCDPDFGHPPKPAPPKSLRDIDIVDDKPLVDPLIMSQLLTPPVDPITSQVCELQTEELPCGVLKEEREKVIRQHEAATKIQACWRGYWARMCLNGDITVVGNLETLSALMNEFFGIYPGAKQAYSLASALGGVYGIAQHQGTSSVTPKCKWIPFFQVVFYCHGPVKVHFDIHSNIQHTTVAVYNNDTKEQLTVLSSINGLFHVCDNNESCKEQPIQPATKLHIDEIFLPNRRNILGGILVAVTRHESISFRAAASSPDVQDLAQCTGKGEIYWPYIRLEPNPPPEVMVSNRNAISQTDMPAAKHAAAQPSDYEPQPDDAYAELECSYAATGSGAVRRDDHRDLEFIAERLAWEYLEVVTPLPESIFNSEKEFGEELLMEGEEELEAELEEEETKYLTKPEQLKDKFIPLYFLPLCMKEKYDEERVVVTLEMAEAAIEARRVRIEAATERMRELQQHDEISVQGRQKNRCQLLEKLFIGKILK
ncbi:Uncharacterized protein OBRU01_00505 [Operophtera brumata]|uniref:Androglobin domain-containing protein n=1 Tax=Operophtera brumata TaxID=104452 RepID=A0A0L7LVZ9_OPEBR|nr:Uncharacterized protein OBRU01_00505 [Operophtera brumata]